MMCAGVEGNERSLCNDDVGGPLFTQDGVVVGIASFRGGFGYPCGREDRPGVYARISGFYDWIQETAGRISRCEKYSFW